MRNPTTLPQSGARQRGWPVSLARPCRPVRAALKDRACGVGVLVLVLLAVALCCALGAWELNRYHSAASLAAAGPPQANVSPAGECCGGAANIDVATLTWVSMVINTLIFIGLGLYLRWDSGRKT